MILPVLIQHQKWVFRCLYLVWPGRGCAHTYMTLRGLEIEELQCGCCHYENETGMLTWSRRLICNRQSVAAAFKTYRSRRRSLPQHLAVSQFLQVVEATDREYHHRSTCLQTRRTFLR